MKLFLSALAAAALVLSPSFARADDKSHRDAAESLLNLMGMESLLSQSIDQMLAMQVKQNPAIAPYQLEMKNFLNKYMSWPSMKEDMVKIYMDEFSESELKELTAFYQTPLGKKTVQRMPTLMSRGAEMGQKRVQEHLPELQAAIAAKGAPAAPAAGAAPGAAAAIPTPGTAPTAAKKNP